MGRSRPTRIGTIDNSGPNTLVAFLRNAGIGCTRIDIAVAFITSAGLDSLLYLLKQTASKGHVRVLTGLYQGFTEPKALRTLLREQDQADGRLSVRISRDGHFHWKAYLLVKSATAQVVIGSSNLTADGLHTSGELNVVLTLGTSSKEFREVCGVFDKNWEAKSEPLTDGVVTRYEEWRKGAGAPPTHGSVPLKTILAGATKERHREPVEARYWRVGIDGHLSDETHALLNEVTNWDKRGYWYFSTWKPTFRAGDRAVLFDLGDQFVGLIEITDTAQTPVRTPDGFHFAAYRWVPGVSRRRLVPNRWKGLKAAGLLKKKGDASLTRKLSERTFDLYREQLKS